MLMASAVMLAGALTAIPAMAESRIDVPFDFTVNGKLCPAGQYEVGHDASRSLVTLRTLTSSRQFQWIVGPGEPSPYDSRVVLRFDERNGGHELQSVQFGGAITRRLDRKPRPSEYVPTQDIQGQ
jgi:hypothetical protein